MHDLHQPVDVAEYLFRRLHEVGIRSIHGVPGDYNLEALDYLEAAGLKWVGNVNELNAGYAADGYARVHGISCLLTTFGVGELAAMSAVAGAYAEYVPVVHIVGTPAQAKQSSGMMLHHTLGNGNFNTFSDMGKQVSCYSASLSDPVEIASQIDAAIRECWIQSRPVYITLPMDMVSAKVEGERLKEPIDLSFEPNDEDKEDYVVDVALRDIYAAKKPIILVDACAIRHRVLPEVHALIKKSGLPTFVAPMGIGAVDESLPSFCGIFAGEGSKESVRLRVEAADLVLSIGSMKTDFNTAGFSYSTSKFNTIDFQSTSVRAKYSEYPDLRMNGVLRKLTERLDTSKLSVVPGPKFTNEIPSNSPLPGTDTITHAWFWPTMSRWLRPRDIIVTETGTPNFGIWETRFPADVISISQVLWGSIGYSLPATQGAALAAREHHETDPEARGLRRTILFIGDGSLQLTVQALGTIIRHKLKPTIFVINNGGFTIERQIHGKEAEYNDIHPWKWCDLVSTLGAREGEFRTQTVETRKQVEELFADESFGNGEKLQFVELVMPRDDVPPGLRITAGKTKGEDVKRK